MKYFSLFLLVLLTACASTPPAREPVLVPETEVVNFPEALLAPCTPLVATKTKYTEAEVIRLVSDWVSAHDDCMRRFQSVADKLRKAFNIETTNSKPSK